MQVWMAVGYDMWICSYSGATNRLINCSIQAMPNGTNVGNIQLGGFIEMSIDQQTNTLYIASYRRCVWCSCGPGLVMCGPGDGTRVGRGGVGGG